MDARSTIDVQQLLDRSAFSGYQWRVFALCFLVVLLDGFDTAAIGYIAPSLMGEWHVAKPQLAPVLSAALFGLTAGSLFAGPLADRLGRKRVLFGSVALFAVASMAAAYSADLFQLTVLRFVTGLGLGAAMPNAVTMMNEYCPAPRRAMLTNAMFCGFPLGAALGGFLAAWMIPQWGWRSVLVAGGIAPLGLAVALLLLLPESVRFMVARAWPLERIRAVLARISPAAANASAFVLAEGSTGDGKGGLKVVFAPRYRVGTFMLWIAYFMGLVIFYALINWMPVLFKEAGLAPKDATMIAALFPLGGVGAIGLGWLMDRFNADRMVAIGFALTAIAIAVIGQAASNVGLLVVAVFCAGAVMNTAQTSLPALAASFYPTAGRATGVSWMLGMGRIGGIGGSFLVAQLAAWQFGFTGILTVLAVPGALAAAALAIKQATYSGDAQVLRAADLPTTH